MFLQTSLPYKISAYGLQIVSVSGFGFGFGFGFPLFIWFLVCLKPFDNTGNLFVNVYWVCITFA